MRQAELADQLTNEQLRRVVVYSQGLFLFISIVLSFFLFDSLADWITLFTFNMSEMVYFGIMPGIIIVLMDLVLISILPSNYYDDGGINKRIFTNLSVPRIFVLTLFIAVSEEMLFRGVIQTTFGYLTASIIFALVHVRYLRKPVLLLSVLLISLFIGYMYEVTNNLLVSITTHFVIDFLLGLIIRYKIWGD
ncbi:CPBP family intramembrane metalloprotease [Ornithinibacillus sp. BX22]|uniref:CPBP family intramembrane metalloprotease n=2 Tax=Ornithinibacillus TaxID=484508 RepID=A0A923L610_9BACI|nr:MULTISPECIES: CPBP family intramembrane glutamic endopeptidase [Ornithinibacillus]MBC5637097.1 CPBP family intramembrane metalloprotease [Ornithinibacillus hominis]MBS3679692.1 CPBP family intramembrane metalloprotease [Ornithinibacillus massiliensis]